MDIYRHARTSLISSLISSNYCSISLQIMGSEQTICSTDLELGLGFSHTRQISTSSNMIHAAVEVTSPAAVRLPSLNLSLSCETYDRNKDRESSDLYRQDSSASSYLSNATVKREREVCGVVFVRAEAAAAERVCSGAVMWENSEVGCKNNYATKNKKQRLSKSQSSLLEETFKQTTTLNSKQKQQLARELNIKPRQVEVWFQNRRARTKLKQIEEDYELLKKCCEKLRDENMRLEKEVQELKALKLSKPSFSIQLPVEGPGKASFMMTHLSHYYSTK